MPAVSGQEDVWLNGYMLSDIMHTTEYGFTESRMVP